MADDKFLSLHTPMPVLRAIRAKCLDCSGGIRAEVDDCLVRTCPLYPFRRGTNPWRKRMSAERRESARQRLAAKTRHNGSGESDVANELAKKTEG